MFNLVTVHDTRIEEISYETDRMKFIGRGNTPASSSMGDIAALSNTDGSVFDPIAAIQNQNYYQEPEQTITFNMVLGITETRECINAYS